MSAGCPNPYVETLEQKPGIVTTTAPEDDVFEVTADRAVKRELIEEFAWAIPTQAVLQRLVAVGPIIEVGAGTGYWASRIEAAGGDVVATDVSPPGEAETWTCVREARHSVVSEYPDRALLLCWPSHGADWPVDAVRAYDGDTVVYVGEGRGGQTGSREMHRVLSHEFGVATDVLEIPQWSSAGDRVYIFTR